MQLILAWNRLGETTAATPTAPAATTPAAPEDIFLAALPVCLEQGFQRQNDSC